MQEERLRTGDSPGGPGWGKEPAERWGTVGAGAELERIPTLPGDYGGFYAALGAALRYGAPPPVDPRDAVSGLEIIEAARSSAEEGRVMEMPVDR